MTFLQVSDYPCVGQLTPVADAFKLKQAGSILYGIWFLLLKKNVGFWDISVNHSSLLAEDTWACVLCLKQRYCQPTVEM